MNIMEIMWVFLTAQLLLLESVISPLSSDKLQQKTPKNICSNDVYCDY